MQLQNNTLTIDAKLDNQALVALAREIASVDSEIESVVVDDSNGVESSALFSLLASIQKTFPSIHIELLGGEIYQLNGIGLTSIKIQK
jgi:ABC-type transporter Mla MlaB component